MKIPLKFLVTGLAGILLMNPFEMRASLEISASVQINAVADFDAPLTSCGDWVTVGSYGRCWHPTGVIVGWRPYCDGDWVWTDCGWYWESDEPWAWACYHYGWWVYDDDYGWVWVPGVEWAPAWVSWRIGGGCIGWAPLPPAGVFSARRPVDAAFVFVDNNHFSGRITPSVVVANNRTIISQTKYVSNIRHVSGNFDGAGTRQANFNEGPGLDAIQRATGRQFKVTAISEAVHRTPMPSRGGSNVGSNHGPGHQPGPADRPETRNAPKPNDQPQHFAPGQPPAQKPFVAPPDHGNNRPFVPGQNVPPSRGPAGGAPDHGNRGNGNGHDQDHGGGGGGHGHGD